MYERRGRRGRRRAKGEVNQRRYRMVESRNGERGLKDFCLEVFVESGVVKNYGLTPAGSVLPLCN